MKPSTEDLLKFARAVAKRGGDHTLNYFRKDLDIERKADDSPVTVADKNTENIMRSMIIEKYPDHGIIGEEHGRVNPDSPVQWILDPIDGTKSFIHGIPLYTTLIGVLVNDKPVAGIIYAPALDEMCDAGVGLGCRFNGKPCRVRQTSNLGKATFLTSELQSVFEGDSISLFNDLVQKTRLHRTWGDAYGHMMVATGRADIMFDPVLEIWDAAPLLPILKEAGGSYFDLRGNERIDTGSGISCSPGLTSEVLAIIRGENIA
ncbi:MAG: inositol monophosphatase family protein [Balneolales bacterium]